MSVLCILTERSKDDVYHKFVVILDIVVLKTSLATLSEKTEQHHSPPSALIVK